MCEGKGERGENHVFHYRIEQKRLYNKSLLTPFPLQRLLPFLYDPSLLPLSSPSSLERSNNAHTLNWRTTQPFSPLCFVHRRHHHLDLHLRHFMAQPRKGLRTSLSPRRREAHFLALARSLSGRSDRPHHGPPPPCYTCEYLSIHTVL